MAKGIRTHIRRRRLQRWLRREAHLLARDAELFDCPHVRREAERLLGITECFGSLAMPRTA